MISLYLRTRFRSIVLERNFFIFRPISGGTTAHIERFIIPKNAAPTRTHLNRKLIAYPDRMKDYSAAI